MHLTRSSKRLTTTLVWITAALAAAATSCAFANKATVQLSRTISVGQELLDLQAARDAGAITEEEFLTLKTKVLKLVDSIEVVDVVNDYTPDTVRGDDDDD